MLQKVAKNVFLSGFLEFLRAEYAMQTANIFFGIKLKIMLENWKIQFSSMMKIGFSSILFYLYFTRIEI